MRFLRSGRRARLLVPALGLAATTLVLLVLVHTPPVRSRVRGWAIDRLRAQAGITATVDDLSYNLLTLDVRLDGVRLSAHGSATPFASARRIQVDLPWSAVFGIPRLDNVELDEPSLTLVRDASGSLNLPASSGADGGPSLKRLQVGRLRIGRASLKYDDEVSRVSAAADGINLTLSPGADGTIAGPLTVEQGPSFRAGDLALDGTIEGSVAYDGRSVTLTSLGLQIPPGRIVMDGRVDIFGTSPALRISLASTLALEQLSTILGVEPPLTGLLSASGALDGPRATPAGSLSLSAQAVGWRHLELLDVRSRLRISGEAAVLEQATARLAGGSVSMSGRLPFDSMRATGTITAGDLTADDLVGLVVSAPLASTLDGRMTFDLDLRAGLPGLTASADVRATSIPARGRVVAVGLDGTAALRVSDGVWRAQHAVTLADAVTLDGVFDGRFTSGAVTDGPINGLLRASAHEPASLLRFLRALGITAPAWLQPDAGRLDARLIVSGHLGDPAARGRITLDGLELTSVRPITANADLALSRHRVAFDGLRATTGRNVLSGTGQLNLVSGAIRGRFDADVTDFVAFGPHVTAWRPDGDLRVALDVDGTRTRPRGRAQVTSTALRAAGQEFGTFAGELTYANGVISATSFQLRQQGGGGLTATGDYSVLSGLHTLALRADRVRLTPIEADIGSWRVEAEVDGTLDSQGTLEEPKGSGRFAVSDVRWEGTRVDRADLEIGFGVSGVALDVRVPSLSLTANAVVAPRAPYRATLDAVAEGTTVSAVVDAVGERVPPKLGRLTGAFSATVKATCALDDLSTLAADGTLRRLELQLDTAELNLERSASAHYTASTLAVSDLRLRTGSTAIDVAGEIAPTSLTGLALTLNGRLADAHPWLSASGAPVGLAMDGTLHADLRAAGSMEQLRLVAEARLDNGRLAWPGYPAVTDITTRMTLANDNIEIPTLEASWQDVSAEARLHVPLALLSRWLPEAVVAGPSTGDSTATLVGRLSNVTPSVAAPFVDAATLDVLKGRAALDVTLRADKPALDRLTGDIVVTELNASVVNVPIEQMQPTQLALENGRLRVVGWTWNVAGSHIGVSGSAGVTGDLDLDLRADGRLDLRVLGIFAPSVTTSGTGDLGVAVRGTAAEPRADGTISLNNGELRVAEPQVGISGASGTIQLSPTRVDVSQLTGSINGGRFSVRGGVDYRGLTATGGELSLDADAVAFDVPAGFRTQLDARLRAAMAERIALTGRVDVVRGAYRDPISLAAIVADAARRRDLADVPPDEETLARRVDLNVAVTSAEDLVLDNNYGRMDLGLDVRLVGTAAAPSVVGRAAVREGGVLFLGGRTYLVERGVIDFSDPRTIVPDLDLSARTRVRGTDEANAPTDYDVTLSVTGTTDRIETTLTSDPPRSQADVVSLLATGRLADQAGGAGTAVARDQVLGYLSGEALGFAARAVGLDSIRFEQGVDVDALQADPSIAGEVNPAQRLTLSRRVSRFVEVAVSQNLRDTGLLTWIVTYAPRRAVEVRTVSRDDRSRSYELRHDVSFGGPATTRVERTAPRSIRVADVRFTGNTVVPAAQLLRRLDLRVSTRFDFYRWQQDRDRLRRFFLDRGFFEARISARQIPQPDASDGPQVSLEYDVDPGPQTSIVVEGYRLPDTTTREIETLWSNAVVAVALADDIRSAVVKHLAEQGQLQAAVLVERRAAADGRAIMHVQIDPGPRATSRTLRIQGNQQFSTLSIEALAARHGIDAWLRPKALADDLASEYRKQGLLNARVTAGPVTFEQAAAFLPVRVDEGLPFHIASVRVEGARARAEETVRQDLGLPAGAPYRPDDVEKARRRLQRGYASDGFAVMSDATRTVVDRERGTVDVVVAINEGPRQIVDRIAVSGTGNAGARVVTETLAVTAGEPVDADAWNASRQRLLQTGLFRRVDFAAVPLSDVSAGPGIEPVRLEVAVVRRTPWRLRYGIDVTDENAPLAERGRVFGGGVNANLERFGLFGRPGTAGLSLRYNRDHRVARGVVTWPSLFGRPLASRLYVSRSHDSVTGENILAFITDKTVVTAEQRFRLFSKAQIAYAYQFERNHVFDPAPNPDDPFAIDERWRQARLTASLVIDTRNDPLDPRAGLLHSSNMEYGLEVLGRSGRFIKYSVQQFVFRELLPHLLAGGGPGIVSASGARVSLGRGFGQDLILSERFYAGGANTVRGYPEDALGGLDFFGEPIPGQATVVLNQELRFPIYRWIRGTGFLDAGNVFTRVEDLSLGSLRVGAGFGLRFTTPLGLLRLDVATPLPRDSRPLAYSFAFGHIF